MLGLFLDDERLPPDNGVEWSVVSDYYSAIAALRHRQFDIVSLDHDLGDFSGPDGREMTGYDVLMWMADRKMTSTDYVPPKIIVHTMNSVALAKMVFVVRRYWT